MPKSNAVLQKEIQSIRTSFRQLARSFSRLGPALAAQLESVPSKAGASSRRKPRLSTRQRAALKLQGKYMGTMRGLPASKRAQVKKIRAEKGIKAAIAYAKKLAA